MNVHIEIVFALLSYFAACLLILGWIWFCIVMARNRSGDSNIPPDDGPDRRPPRRPPPRGDRSLSHPKRADKPTRKSISRLV